MKKVSLVTSKTNEIKGIIIGNHEKEIVNYGSPTYFFSKVMKEFMESPEDLEMTTKDKSILFSNGKKYGVNFYSLRDKIKEIPENKIQFGEGSNIIKKNNVKISQVRQHKNGPIDIAITGQVEDKTYFDCIDLDTNKEFTYYRDNLTGKRYFKEDTNFEEVKHINLAQLASLELDSRNENLTNTRKAMFDVLKEESPLIITSVANEMYHHIDFNSTPRETREKLNGILDALEHKIAFFSEDYDVNYLRKLDNESLGKFLSDRHNEWMENSTSKNKMMESNQNEQNPDEDKIDIEL